MIELIGSERAVKWAIEIRAKHAHKWRLAFDNFRNSGVSQEFLDALDLTIAIALEQRDAKVWIDCRTKGEVYSIATAGRIVSDLRKHLEWSREEELAIGFGVFDKILDYAV